MQDRLSQLSTEKTAVLSDDIECEDWLDEIGLSQYAETFITNFSLSGSTLNRKRLARLRLQDFPQMNICNFEHQKILMDHIRLTLQYAYSSPVRKKEVRMKNFARTKSAEDVGPSKKQRFKEQLKQADHKSQASPRRRRSFDNGVWRAVAKSRSSDTKAVEKLREGNASVGEPSVLEGKKSSRVRRYSFGVEDVSDAEKGRMYGNRAQQYDIIKKELDAIQGEYLNVFRNMINCEKASILFLHPTTRELVLCTDGMWRTSLSNPKQSL